jgi:regulator of PEP synthase PpsR (kinase-PPPase family)
MVSEVPAYATVYVVSDSAGDTGELAARAAATQFYPSAVRIKRIPFVDDETAIDRVVALAKEEKSLILFTIVIEDLRSYLVQQAQTHSIVCIDLLSPIIGSLEILLDRPANHKPGMIHKLDDDYFKKVNAVEFAVKYDDGRDPRGILAADIVLLGVSRTSKTPLSMFLAHKKFKAANVPLVPELAPPDELFVVSPNKIVGLTISPDKLNMIRKERLKALGLAANASYAEVNRINQELEYAMQVMKKLDCTVIDVSDKAVEETASMIVDIFHAK